MEIIVEFITLTEPSVFFLAALIGSDTVDFASIALLSDGVTRCAGNDIACSSSSPDVSDRRFCLVVVGVVWKDFVITFMHECMVDDEKYDDYVVVGIVDDDFDFKTHSIDFVVSF